MSRRKRDTKDKLHITPLEERILVLLQGGALYRWEMERALRLVYGREGGADSLAPTLLELRKRGMIEGFWENEEPPEGEPRYYYRYYKIKRRGARAINREALRLKQLRDWPRSKR